MPRPRSDIRPRILNAARTRFLHDGVDGASLRAIARDADTNIGMIYYYFPTKDDLFLAVVEERYQGLMEDLTKILDPQQAVEDRLRGLFDRMAALSPEEFDVIRIVIREALVSSERLGQVLGRFQQGHIPLVLQTVGEGVASGTLTNRQPMPAVVLAVASLMGLPQLVRHTVKRNRPELAAMLPAPDALARSMFDLLMGGVRGSETPSV